MYFSNFECSWPCPGRFLYGNARPCAGLAFLFFGTCAFRTESEPRPLQQGMAKMFWRLTGVCSLKRVASGVPEVEKTHRHCCLLHGCCDGRFVIPLLDLF